MRELYLLYGRLCHLLFKIYLQLWTLIEDARNNCYYAFNINLEISKRVKKTLENANKVIDEKNTRLLRERPLDFNHF